MGWDAYANIFNRENDMKKFRLKAEEIRNKCGSVDSLLSYGGLDCSACAFALQDATEESAWIEDGWDKDKVKLLALNAKWPENIEKENCWAIESAKAFLNLCADLEIDIHFSF